MDGGFVETGNWEIEASERGVGDGRGNAERAVSVVAI